MTLYLARLPIDMNDLVRASKDRGWTAGRQSTFDQGAALHHLLGEAFGPAALQPFRAIIQPRRRLGTLYAYTLVSGDELRDIAAPLARTAAEENAVDPERLETKPITPRGGWQPGQRIGFDVRVRPIVRLGADLPAPQNARRPSHGFRKGAELDAFLAKTLRMPEHTLKPDRETVYADWLQARMGAAVEIESTTLARFSRTVVLRGGAKSEGPDAVMHGTLSINDPKGFAKLLASGVSRHKAYGYGMLLLRPPGRRVSGR